jgi:hypothetical protein
MGRDNAIKFTLRQRSIYARIFRVKFCSQMRLGRKQNRIQSAIFKIEKCLRVCCALVLLLSKTA